jgi:predicted MFS family arabinose efflux permease
MDRFGQLRVLLPTALTSAALLAALALATTGGAPAHTLVALAVGVGLSYPAIGPALRSSFRIALPDPGDRRVAFALDATSVELAFVCGPLLLSALLLPGVAAVPLLVTAGLLAVGGVGYCLTGVARRASATTQRAAAGHDAAAAADGPRSALTAAGVPLVLAVMLVISIGFGQLDTSMAGTADLALGSTERVGILFAAIAGGSTLGGLTYGSRRWSISERRAVPRLLAVFAVLLTVLAVLLATHTTQLVVLLPVLFLTGLTIAPTLIMQQALLDQLVPAARLNEAQAFLSASNTAGAALGTAVAGVVIDMAGLSWSFGGAALGVGVAALVARLSRRGRGH